MKEQNFKKYFFIPLFPLILLGCAGHSREVDYTISELNRQRLAWEIDPGFIYSLFEDERFEVYEVAQRKESYDRITTDFYKSPSFGLFTPWGEKQARNFIRNYEHYLNKALDRFNLPHNAAAVISALAGIEYSWGQLNPRHRVFNSLYSVYKQIPTHENFALRNIRGLKDGIENPYIEIDPFAPSSFMGAIGYCQLMPMWFTTITERNLEEKLDLDSSGAFDPFSMPDAIAFFAWYLSESGYNRDRWNAVRLYNGTGPAAEAFADAVIEFAEKIGS